MKPIDYRPANGAAPAQVAALIADGAARVATIAKKNARIPLFVESNYLIAWQALSDIRARGYAPGNRFCEWGSGAGIVTCLAAMAGFDACGIEIEAPLVAVARDLAALHAPSAVFHCRSYQPDGAFEDNIDMAALRAGTDPTAFDVIYAYPWKAEERVVLTMFSRYAPPAAVLVVYRGGGDMRIYRNETG